MQELVSPADRLFVAELPPHLEDLGGALLKGVRSFYPEGNLVFHSTSKKFVETPNFWTVRIQPRDGSLAVTLYGRWDTFVQQLDTIEVKRDRGDSYSRFKINKLFQLPDALFLIRQAGEKKGVL